MVADEDRSQTKRLATLSLGALGVVYGDIGTSPLYAFRESFAEEHVTADPGNILGALSLIVWSLIIVISIKYLVFVMRADHDGEGGILALTALIPRTGDYHGKGRRRLLVLVGLFGTALLYGDGMITPAISVLSAVEGISVATEALDPLIIPIAIAILIGLFSFQRRGTGAVGAVFGPIMVVWFTVLATLGIGGIIRDPSVLVAVSPTYAVQFFVANGFVGVLVLGAVFLVVTGGEALYADLGHFGRKPIQTAWFALVLPGLLLNYFGQGALLLRDPTAIDNPFYRLAPGWATIPLVILATVATVIASQALISGVFSLSMQAVQMGYLPRLRVQHTSESQEGQVYIPGMNWTLMLACIGLVLGFRTSSGLAAAYGVAVTTTMVVTTLLFYVVARERFEWQRGRTVAVCGAFLVVDVAFFVGNMFKIPDGGWFPLVIGGIVYTAMATWRRGRSQVANRQRKGLVPVDRFLKRLDVETPRVPGAAYYLTADPQQIPASLLVNLRHNNALHEQIVLLHVHVAGMAHVPTARRAKVETLEKGFSRVTLRYGFRDRIDVPQALEQKVFHHKGFDDEDITYVVGNEDVYATERPGMPLWRERLFTVMYRNASNVTQLFDLPMDRVVEIGQPVDI
ncbi:MAG: potassium transporter Kup [Actinobacteria bacterium]|nr:potassium transporter Kup [Actinomycetota bacterium]